MISKYRRQGMTDTMKDILDEKQIDIFSIVWSNPGITTKKIRTIYGRGYSIRDIYDICYKLKRLDILRSAIPLKLHSSEDNTGIVGKYFVDTYGYTRRNSVS